jgi:hypothetical protein
LSARRTNCENTKQKTIYGSHYIMTFGSLSWWHIGGVDRRPIHSKASNEGTNECHQVSFCESNVCIIRWRQVWVSEFHQN